MIDGNSGNGLGVWQLLYTLDGDTHDRSNAIIMTCFKLDSQSEQMGRMDCRSTARVLSDAFPPRSALRYAFAGFGTTMPVSFRSFADCGRDKRWLAYQYRLVI